VFGKCSGQCQEYASVVYEDSAKVCILGELPGGLAGQGQMRLPVGSVPVSAEVKISSL